MTWKPFFLVILVVLAGVLVASVGMDVATSGSAICLAADREDGVDRPAERERATDRERGEERERAAERERPVERQRPAERARAAEREGGADRQRAAERDREAKDARGPVFRVIGLEFLPAVSARETLGQLLDSPMFGEGEVRRQLAIAVNEPANAVVLVGPAEVVEKIEEMLHQLDAYADNRQETMRRQQMMRREMMLQDRQGGDVNRRKDMPREQAERRERLQRNEAERRERAEAEEREQRERMRRDADRPNVDGNMLQRRMEQFRRRLPQLQDDAGELRERLQQKVNPEDMQQRIEQFRRRWPQLQDDAGELRERLQQEFNREDVQRRLKELRDLSGQMDRFFREYDRQPDVDRRGEREEPEVFEGPGWRFEFRPEQSLPRAKRL
ncbi:MAG: hypothetical protein JXL80_04260 [Planctomycetes bacterium]|nr:hypothetical protein [Planctomycetota bacterium]